MTAHPHTTSADALAAETVVVMREGSINGLFAINDAREPIGALNMLDLVRAGIF
jgi:arabinose-5-phosphate isomerase